MSRDPWQPIETAPKDRTRILLYQPKGQWQPNRNSGIDRGEWIAIGYWHTPGNPEREGFWCGATWNGTFRPTHWMPLPAPPEPA